MAASHGLTMVCVCGRFHCRPRSETRDGNFFLSFAQPLYYPLGVMTTTAVPNGIAEASIPASKLPLVVGINLGNSFASIAVFTKVNEKKKKNVWF